jgi:hypothetical protein
MAPPVITPERRAEALLKAARVRKERAELKDKLKNGTVTLAEALAAGETSDVIGKIRVTELLKSMPGVGKVRAQQLMELHGIAKGRRVRGLGVNQREALEAEFAGA